MIERIVEKFVKLSMTWKLEAMFIAYVVFCGFLALINVNSTRMIWCIMAGFGIWACIGANLLRRGLRDVKKKKTETS